MKELDLAVFAVGFGRTNCGQSEPCEGDFDSDYDVDESERRIVRNLER